MKPTTLGRAFAPLAVAGLAAACATAGSTIGSGVGDELLDQPPWYAGGSVINSGPIAHLPITFQRGATDSEAFDVKSRPGSAVAALLAEMNRYLDSLAVTTPLRDVHATGTPPDVQFGCEPAAHVECSREHAGEMRMAVARPARAWIDSIRAAATRARAHRVLVITLEAGNYFPEQTDLRGSKRVQLGTGYSVDVPWLTALDKPVSVLQLAGALMDTTGTAVRIGAEGLLAKRTNIVLSGLGVQAQISDDDVEKLRTTHRTEIKGSPLVWQAALRNMVAQLAGRPELTTY
ncbi:MAG TPA: hypothetical protein VF021_11285 [Longimicrobiales bacterium]